MSVREKEGGEIHEKAKDHKKKSHMGPYFTWETQKLIRLIILN